MDTPVFVDSPDGHAWKTGDIMGMRLALQAYERGEGKQSKTQKAFAAAQAKRSRESMGGQVKAGKIRRAPKTPQEKKALRTKVWKRLFPEKHKVNTRLWRQRHPEKNAELARRYYARNRERIIARVMARKASLKK